MTLDAVVLLIGGTILFAGTFALPFVFYPAYRRSRFRHAMWQLRDQLVDDVLDDELPRARIVDELIQVTEFAVEHAPHASLVKFLLMPKELTEGFGGWADERSVQLSEMTGAQRERFKHYEKVFERATMAYLLTSSPVGWAFTVVFGVVYCVGALLKGNREPVEAAKDRTIKELADPGDVEMYWNTAQCADNVGGSRTLVAAH